MRLSIRRVSIVTLGLLFLFASAFAAPKKEKLKVGKKQKTEQASQSNTTKSVSDKSENQIKDPVQNTTIENQPTNADAVIPQQSNDIPATAPATSGRAATYSINWFVIAAGGTAGASTNYAINGTVGQTSVGMGSSTNFNINAGFWQNFGGGGCCVGTRGDVNGDGSVTPNILDLNVLVNYIFRFSGNPGPCPEESDVNATGGTPNILDLNVLVNYIFRMGPLPPACP